MPTSYVNTGIGNGGVGASTVSLAVVFDFLAGQNGQSVNSELFNANSPCTVQSINLVTGNNAISATTCPAIAQAAGVFIIPPPTNGSTLSLKKVNADTGIPIAWAPNPTCAPTFLALANPPLDSFVINASSSVTGLLLVWV